MSDFVDRFASVLSCIKLVGEVENVCVSVADILVSVHHTRWNDDGAWVVLSDNDLDLPRLESWAVFPEPQFVAAIDKRKEVGLGNVLVRSARDPWMGDADVRHSGKEALGKFVRAEQLSEVSSRVSERFQALNYNAGRQIHPLNCTAFQFSTTIEFVRVVLTGGAGFLGSHLADRLLAEGHDVMIIDNFVTGTRRNIEHLVGNPRVTIHEYDCCLPLDVEGTVDFVAHFASPASPDDFRKIPFDVLRVGSHGTESCLNLCVKKGARFIFASTSEVYGDPAISPQPESYWGNVNPIGPRAVYDEAKRFGEAMTMAYHRFRGVDSRIIRFFNTYGPRMRLDDGRVVPNFVSQALRGEPLTVYGSGANTRSFGYYSDAIDCVYRLMMSDVHEPVNIGSQEERTMLEFAHAVLKATGSSSSIVHVEAAEDDPKQRRPDTTRAKELLGWSPTTSLEDGLAKTVEYFKGIV